MFDETGLRMMALAGTGYCCSQIMVVLALEGMGRENPDLVRAAAGLCHGVGGCEGPCGILVGGSAVLGLHAGKGTDDEEPDERLPLLLAEFADWFRERATAQYGGISCGAILGDECGKPDPSRCGPLLSEAYGQILDLLTAQDIDPTQGRGDGLA